jgi:NTP pyrophosphatase (non-canonical NTP hydrolase)
MKKFNNEDLNLTILMEECAEVIQVCSKIKRFGIDDYHPVERKPNRELLEEELGHVAALMGILVENHTITEKGVTEQAENKLKKLENWYEPRAFT